MRSVVNRLVAAIIASVFAWLSTKFGIVVDPQDQQAIALAVGLAVYGAVHTLSSAIRSWAASRGYLGPAARLAELIRK